MVTTVYACAFKQRGGAHVTNYVSTPNLGKGEKLFKETPTSSYTLSDAVKER